MPRQLEPRLPPHDQEPVWRLRDRRARQGERPGYRAARLKIKVVSIASPLQLLHAHTCLPDLARPCQAASESTGYRRWIKYVTQELAVSPAYDARFWNPASDGQVCLQAPAARKASQCPSLRGPRRHLFARAEGCNIQGVHQQHVAAHPGTWDTMPSSSWPSWNTPTTRASGTR